MERAGTIQTLKRMLYRSVEPAFYRRRFREGWRRLVHSGESPRCTGIDEISGIRRVRRVAVVLAHPDDEVFCSGLICELVERGCRIKAICLTRGEGGPAGHCTREELGEVRSEEMARACEELGVDELVFLGHLDPFGDDLRCHAPDVSKDDLALQLLPCLEGIDLVVCHGSNGEYWHPGHMLVHEATGLAVDGMGNDPPAWMTFQARRRKHPLPRMVNWGDPAYLELDVSRHEGRRLRALECHRSQLGFFSNYTGGTHRDFIRLTSVESYALQCPGRLESAKAV